MKGAGRKAKRHADGSRVEPTHERRAHFTKSRPLHVTVEVAEDVPNLRATGMAPLVWDAIGRANRRKDFRSAPTRCRRRPGSRSGRKKSC